MTSGYQVPSEIQRLQAMLENMRKDIDNLQGKVVRIPTLQADPSLLDSTNLWFMDDGRLRGRLRDGTLVEYARSNHTHPSVAAVVQGGGTATVAPPTPPYAPKTRVYVSGTDWTQCYRSGGSIQRTDKPYLFYGYYDSFNQELKSMIHFPGLSALAPGPKGTRIAEVYLTLINMHTNLNSGAELRLGLHDSTTKPGTFQETQWSPMKVHVNKSGFGATNVTYRLPTWVGDRMRDGTAQGFTLNQRTTNRAYYGYAAVYGKLRIVYVK